MANSITPSAHGAPSVTPHPWPAEAAECLDFARSVLALGQQRFANFNMYQGAAVLREQIDQLADLAGMANRYLQRVDELLEPDCDCEGCSHP